MHKINRNHWQNHYHHYFIYIWLVCLSYYSIRGLIYLTKLDNINLKILLNLATIDGYFSSSIFITLISLIILIYLLLKQHKYSKRINYATKRTPILASSEDILNNNKCINSWWLGKGFIWQTEHIQKTKDYLKSNQLQNDNIGENWIHSINDIEEDIYLPIEHTDGHMLLIGTTGSGKSRAFDIFIQQAIIRNESVVIIDPKGDQQMRDNTMNICNKLNIGDKFLVFHPAFPEQSIAIDTLANYSKTSDLAARIIQIMPSTGPNGEAFRSFSYNAVLTILDTLVYLNHEITLVAIYNALTIGVKNLLSLSLKQHFKQLNIEFKNKDELFEVNISAELDTRSFNKIVNYYKDVVNDKYPNEVITSLIGLYQHDKTHLQKMIASFIPSLKLLATGKISEIICPTINKKGNKFCFNFNQLLQDNYVVYIGLDSLTDYILSSNLGSMLLGDLASLAGMIYNYQATKKPINIFIDEASEIINEPFIQILNKGRGAALRCFVATQTLADLTVRTNSIFKTRQILGNFNNWLALRTTDLETQEYLANNLYKVNIYEYNNTYNKNPSNLIDFNHQISQSLIKEQTELFPPNLFANIPNFEYFGKFSGGKLIKGRLPILKN